MDNGQLDEPQRTPTSGSGRHGPPNSDSAAPTLSLQRNQLALPMKLSCAVLTGRTEAFPLIIYRASPRTLRLPIALVD